MSTVEQCCEGENLLKPSEVPHSMYESMLEIQNKLKLYNGWKEYFLRRK